MGVKTMINIIKSEFHKSRNTSINKFIIITPLFTIFLSLLWGGGQNGAYNWWYVIFLPGLISIISAQVITIEENLSYKALLLYPQDKGAMWLGKIIYMGILLVLINIIFMVGIILVGFIYEPTISLNSNILGTMLLIATLLFQIPISLFLTVRFNMFVSILFNIVMTFFGVISFGTKYFVTFYSYGITSTLMVPILHILPNGLPVVGDIPLLNMRILPGIATNLLIFLILTILTTIWFRNKEVY